MPQVTYNGAQPVVTPTLGADGNTDLGVWEPGQTKDVPDEVIAGLCSEGSAFSASAEGAAAPESPDEGPAPASVEQKSGGGLFRRA